MPRAMQRNMHIIPILTRDQSAMLISSASLTIVKRPQESADSLHILVQRSPLPPISAAWGPRLTALEVLKL